jgi:hypothetical protein
VTQRFACLPVLGESLHHRAQLDHRFVDAAVREQSRACFAGMRRSGRHSLGASRGVLVRAPQVSKRTRIVWPLRMRGSERPLRLRGSTRFEQRLSQPSLQLRGAGVVKQRLLIPRNRVVDGASAERGKPESMHGFQMAGRRRDDLREELTSATPVSSSQLGSSGSDQLAKRSHLARDDSSRYVEAPTPGFRR